MSTPSFASQAAAAGGYPSSRFNKREQKLLASTKAYLDAGISSSQIANDAVTLAKLAPGIEPSHIVKYAGSFTTVGGDANESISVSGVLGTDIAIVTLHTKGAVPCTILTTQAAANAINLEFSADPSNDHVVKYVVYRAVS